MAIDYYQDGIMSAPVALKLKKGILDTSVGRWSVYPKQTIEYVWGYQSIFSMY